MGPFVFNIFLNDVFYFIEKGKLFNYADENTLPFSHPDFVTLLTVLEQECRVLIDWFSRNCMKENSEKFQAFAVGEKTYGEKPTFKIGETEIECEKTVKLLGVEIDYLLTFDTQVSNMCKKASQQINVLKRIGKYLNFESREAVYHASIMSTLNFCP